MFRLASLLLLLPLCQASPVADHPPVLDPQPVPFPPNGESYPPPLEENEEAFRENWLELSRMQLREQLAVTPNNDVARNIIMYVGDGMGPTTTAAARIYQAQTQDLRYSQSVMAWDNFPHSATSRTFSTTNHVTDSAASAAGYLCGEKTMSGMVGVGQRGGPRGDCRASQNHKLKSILKHAQDAGKWVGIVTNTRITHAAPANGYASVGNSDWEYDIHMPAEEREYGCTDIAQQLIEDDYAKHFRVIMGGGREGFLPDGKLDGKRMDGRDLVSEWLADKLSRQGMMGEAVQYVTGKAGFDKVDPSKTEFLFGLFASSNMKYEKERLLDPTEPSLTEMVEKAVKILRKNPQGYFLLVESGRIGLAHHDNYAHLALNETVKLSDTVRRVMQLTGNHDTLTVVTADHSHPFTLGGYAAIDRDILDVTGRVHEDGKPWLSLGYQSGPGWTYHRADGYRRDLTQDSQTRKLRDTYYQFDASVNLPWDTHAGEDVMIHATGPRAHLFNGVKLQTYIAHAVMWAGCFGSNTAECRPTTTGGSWGSVNAAPPVHAGHGWVLVLTLAFVLYRTFFK